MISLERAIELASDRPSEGLTPDVDNYRELEHGWFFPFKSTTGENFLGTQGLIVNKTTGDRFELGSRFPIERDLEMYDQGLQFGNAGLVVLSVEDREVATSVLYNMGVSYVVVEYEADTIWRQSKAFKPERIREHLESLPHVYEDVDVYFKFELLVEARKRGAFQFKLFKSKNA